MRSSFTLLTLSDAEYSQGEIKELAPNSSSQKVNLDEITALRRSMSLSVTKKRGMYSSIFVRIENSKSILKVRKHRLHYSGIETSIKV